MKHLNSTLLACILFVSASASPVTFEQARTQAISILSSVKHAPTYAVPVNDAAYAKTRGFADASAPAYYIFNASDQEGFVILSGDDEFPSLLGYSAEGFFADDASDMPEALRLLLDNYAQYVDAVRAGMADAPARQVKHLPANYTAVAPLLTCKWGQSEPFNLCTPDNWPTGCGATALSQIMYYWKWPETGTGTASYNDGTGSKTIDFSESHYQWSKMKDSYSAIDSKKASGQIVAKLCLDCGVAMNMTYGQEGSSAFVDNAITALIKHFRYKSSTLKYYRDIYIESRERFDNLVYGELLASRPVFFAASSAVGSGGDAAGHAYVVDGCDSEGLVHVNWGWSGGGNGYYAISEMNVSAYRFCLNQRIIVGIQPDYAGTDNELKPVPIATYGLPTISATSVAVDGMFTVQIDTLVNNLSYSVNVQLGIGLYDKDGRCLEENITASDYFLTIQSDYRYFGLEKLNCKLSTRPADGDYGLRLVHRINNFSEYILPFTPGGHSANWIPIQISNGRIYFNQVSAGIAEVDKSDKPVASVSYFDLAGRKISHPTAADGLIVERRTYTDGTVASFKHRIR